MGLTLCGILGNPSYVPSTRHWPVFSLYLGQGAKEALEKVLQRRQCAVRKKHICVERVELRGPGREARKERRHCGGMIQWTKEEMWRAEVRICLITGQRHKLFGEYTFAMNDIASGKQYAISSHFLLV